MTSFPACLLNVAPVVHPPNLEGDPTLATEILPGPPSLDSIRQLAKRNEPRRHPASSYLPLSDPGTTYTSLAGGMAAIALDENGPRRKRARVDKSISNRAQRASARNLAGNATLNDQALVSEMEATSSHAGLDEAVSNDDDRSTSHSRSTSLPLNGDAPTQSASTNGTRAMNGKGKGKEKENSDRAAQVRVKEEPVAVQIGDVPPANEDHCSSCSSVGALVYCDGCPRAFHLWCLDPPMDPSDFPDGEESWYCPGCKADRGPPAKPSHTFFSPLIQQLHYSIPTEFRLPEEIRTFFRDVGTGSNGTYVDNSSIKTIRLGRHGLGEERDPYRLKDNKGAAVICFRCGKSALPDDSGLGHSSNRSRRSSTDLSQSDHWKSLVSCDFCPLHWHVDCLEPPLASLPPINRKWKCPNHATSSAPKMRTPRTSGPPIDITETRQRNNGNIEVINSDIPQRVEEKMAVDEVLINGRKYRVPERIIMLDFWSKVKQQKSNRRSGHASSASSPLTSLSSLDEQNEQPPPFNLSARVPDSNDDDTLQVAQLLCGLQSAGPSRPTESIPIEKGSRIEQDDHIPQKRQKMEHVRTSTSAPVVKNQRSHRRGLSTIPLNKSLSEMSISFGSVKLPAGKRGANKGRSSRSAHLATSNSESHTVQHQDTRPHKESVPRATTTQPTQDIKANHNPPTTNGVRDTAPETREDPPVRANTAGEPSPTKTTQHFYYGSRYLRPTASIFIPSTNSSS
ncbi:uncharacterized protein FOMMEDRAFT_145119 [Fomitiporia mediterranea MF3/22]|uniref:uncharacterized protein n=1 Tax=Fomitiporia mediterranea (strain MF3/22) TaxID=694068 RepID=UPI0004407E6A|nr:uncharacterized protein FOMMEDRAFT_145119 [Fomitiporia mediterranea MF3/22]EJD05666.1 hypothetical protein FOMMEDRAFT_145119 [Fomitiporia mediterranea MF3/22]